MLSVPAFHFNLFRVQEHVHTARAGRNYDFDAARATHVLLSEGDYFWVPSYNM